MSIKSTAESVTSSGSQNNSSTSTSSSSSSSSKSNKSGFGNVNVSKQSGFSSNKSSAIGSKSTSTKRNPNSIYTKLQDRSAAFKEASILGSKQVHGSSAYDRLGQTNNYAGLDRGRINALRTANTKSDYSNRYNDYIYSSSSTGKGDRNISKSFYDEALGYSQAATTAEDRDFWTNAANQAKELYNYDNRSTYSDTYQQLAELQEAGKQLEKERNNAYRSTFVSMAYKKDPAESQSNFESLDQQLKDNKTEQTRLEGLLKELDDSMESMNITGDVRTAIKNLTENNYGGDYSKKAADQKIVDDFYHSIGMESKYFSTTDKVVGVFKAAGDTLAAGYTNATAYLSRMVDYGYGIQNVEGNEYAGWATDDVARSNMNAAEYEKNRAEYTKAWEEAGGNNTIFDRAADKLEVYADNFSQGAARELAQTKAGLGKFGQFMVDAGHTALTVGADMVVAGVTGGSSLVPMFVRVFGESAGEARRAGASFSEQGAYGFTKASIETVSEKMFGAFDKLGYGKGFLPVGGIEDALTKMAKSDVGKYLVKGLYQSVEEGAEEVFADLAAPFAKWIIDEQSRGHYFSEIETSELFRDFLLGSALGGFGSVVGSGTTISNIQQADIAMLAEASRAKAQGKELTPEQQARLEKGNKYGGLSVKDARDLRRGTVEKGKPKTGAERKAEREARKEQKAENLRSNFEERANEKYEKEAPEPGKHEAPPNPDAPIAEMFDAYENSKMPETKTSQPSSEKVHIPEHEQRGVQSPKHNSGVPSRTGEEYSGKHEKGNTPGGRNVEVDNIREEAKEGKFESDREAGQTGGPSRARNSESWLGDAFDEANQQAKDSAKQQTYKPGLQYEDTSEGRKQAKEERKTEEKAAKEAVTTNEEAIAESANGMQREVRKGLRDRTNVARKAIKEGKTLDASQKLTEAEAREAVTKGWLTEEQAKKATLTNAEARAQGKETGTKAENDRVAANRKLLGLRQMVARGQELTASDKLTRQEYTYALEAGLLSPKEAKTFRQTKAEAKQAEAEAQLKRAAEEEARAKGAEMPGKQKPEKQDRKSRNAQNALGRAAERGYDFAEEPEEESAPLGSQSQPAPLESQGQSQPQGQTQSQAQSQPQAQSQGQAPEKQTPPESPPNGPESAPPNRGEEAPPEQAETVKPSRKDARDMSADEMRAEIENGTFTDEDFARVFDSTKARAEFAKAIGIDKSDEKSVGAAWLIWREGNNKLAEAAEEKRNEISQLWSRGGISDRTYANQMVANGFWSKKQASDFLKSRNTGNKPSRPGRVEGQGAEGRKESADELGWLYSSGGISREEYASRMAANGHWTEQQSNDFLARSKANEEEQANNRPAASKPRQAQKPERATEREDLDERYRQGVITSGEYYDRLVALGFMTKDEATQAKIKAKAEEAKRQNEAIDKEREESIALTPKEIYERGKKLVLGKIDAIFKSMDKSGSDTLILKNRPGTRDEEIAQHYARKFGVSESRIREISRTQLEQMRNATDENPLYYIGFKKEFGDNKGLLDVWRYNGETLTGIYLDENRNIVRTVPIGPSQFDVAARYINGFQLGGYGTDAKMGQDFFGVAGANPATESSTEIGESGTIEESPPAEEPVGWDNPGIVDTNFLDAAEIHDYVSRANSNKTIYIEPRTADVSILFDGENLYTLDEDGKAIGSRPLSRDEFEKMVTNYTQDYGTLISLEDGPVEFSEEFAKGAKVNEDDKGTARNRRYESEGQDTGTAESPDSILSRSEDVSRRKAQADAERYGNRKIEGTEETQRDRFLRRVDHYLSQGARYISESEFSTSMKAVQTLLRKFGIEHVAFYYTDKTTDITGGSYSTDTKTIHVVLVGKNPSRAKATTKHEIMHRIFDIHKISSLENLKQIVDDAFDGVPNGEKARRLLDRTFEWLKPKYAIDYSEYLSLKYTEDEWAMLDLGKRISEIKALPQSEKNKVDDGIRQELICEAMGEGGDWFLSGLGADIMLPWQKNIQKYFINKGYVDQNDLKLIDKLSLQIVEQEKKATIPGMPQPSTIQKDITSAVKSEAYTKDAGKNMEAGQAFQWGKYDSATTEEVSRVADYRIQQAGKDAERTRLLDSNNWDRTDFAEAHKLIVDFSMAVNNKMVNGKYKTDVEYQADRYYVDELMEKYRQMKSEMGQKLQQEYKISLADEIRMRAAHRFLNYSPHNDGRVFAGNKYSGIYRTIDNLLKAADKATQKGDVNDMIKVVEDASYIRGNQAMFGKLGVNGEHWALEYLRDNGATTEDMANLLYGDINRMIDDFDTVRPLNMVQNFRTLNLLSALRTANNNLLNNAAGMRVGAISQNIGYLAAKQFENATGKKVAIKDTSVTRLKKGTIKAEAVAFVNAALMSYYGINAENGRLELNNIAKFNPNGNFFERLGSRYSFIVSTFVMNPDQMGKARIDKGLQDGIEQAFQGVTMTPEMKANKAELEGYKEYEKNRRLVQADNSTVRLVQHFKDYLNKAQLGNKDIGYIKLGDFAMPFAKVPVNIVQQRIAATPYGAMYHLLNAAKGYHDAVKMHNDVLGGVEGAKEMSAKDMAKYSMNVGRAATTGGMLAIGAIAAMAGALRDFGNEDDDDDEAKIWRNRGYTGLTLNISAMLGLRSEWRKDDWVVGAGFLEIFAAPLAIGALAWDAHAEGMSVSEAAWYATKRSFTDVLDAIADIPGMQAASQMYEAYTYAPAGEDNLSKTWTAVRQYLANAASGYVMPNAFTQAATGLDNTMRNPYVADTPWQQSYQIFANKIPFLRNTLPAKLDMWGNPRQYAENKFLAFMNKTILPGAVRQIRSDKYEDEIIRLSQAGYRNMLPVTSVPNKVEVGENSYELNKEQKLAYEAAYKERYREYRDNFMDSVLYQQLDDGQRVGVLKQLKLDAGRQTKQEFLESINAADSITMDKWETELDNFEDQLDFLGSKQIAASIWNSDENMVGNYAAMDKFIQGTYNELSEPVKKLLGNSYSHLDDLYDASQEGINSERWQTAYNIYREWEDSDEKSNIANEAKMWSQIEKAIGANNSEMNYIEQHMQLHFQGTPDTDQYYEYLNDAGLTRDEASNTLRAMNNLQAQDGYSSIQNNQKYMVICDTVPANKQWAAFWSIVPSNAGKKNVAAMKKAQESGIDLRTALRSVGWSEIKGRRLKDNGKYEYWTISK